MGVAETTERIGISVWRAHNGRDRSLLTLGAILCYFIFFWLGNLFDIPRYRGYADGLIQQPAPLIAVLIAICGIVAGALLATLITGVVHFDAGLFCAGIGLAALSTRGGSITYVLMQSSGPRIFNALALE